LNFEAQTKAQKVRVCKFGHPYPLGFFEVFFFRWAPVSKAALGKFEVSFWGISGCGGVRTDNGLSLSYSERMDEHTKDQGLGPDDFELGDEVTEVFLAPPDQRGIVVSLHFKGDEARELVRRVEFDEALLAQWCKAVILEKVYAQTWVKYVRVSA